MKYLFISVMIIISGVISAQECKIDLHSLAQPDNKMIQFNKFGQSRLFTIVLSEGFDAIANKEIIDQFSQWFLNQNSGIRTVNINDVKKVFLLLPDLEKQPY
jgi:F420-0:gamma-glutamyl ligase